MIMAALCNGGHNIFGLNGTAKNIGFYRPTTTDNGPTAETTREM